LLHQLHSLYKVLIFLDISRSTFAFNNHLPVHSLLKPPTPTFKMKSAVVLALAGLAIATPAPQATQAGGSNGAPLGPAPANCDKNYNGNFEITIVDPSNIPNQKRQAGSCGQPGILTLNLKNGNLMDVDGRTGYIASKNSQFQFDKPVQAGGIYAGEFSVCKNGSIALGSTTTFYRCQSGDFYNLYYDNVAAQCAPINIDVIPCDGAAATSGAQKPASSMASSATAAAASGAKPVSVSADGQPQGTAAPSVAVVSAYTDGQPQATAAPTSVKPAVVSQFTDGQPQATAAATAKSNATIATAAPASATPTIATAGAVAMSAPLFLAGAMAFFALL